MEIKGKVHCFFEQSGTFKNEFIKLGIPAECYDVQNNFGETDHIIDLFTEIEKAYNNKESVFDSITKDDLVIAFFPCIYFSAVAQINISINHPNNRNRSLSERYSNSLERMKKRQEFLVLLVKLFENCELRGIRLIVENPWALQTFLKNGFIYPPSYIDNDRTRRGDYFRKPTAFWFVNCEPTNGLTITPTQKNKIKTINKCRKGVRAGICSEERSMISSDYARNFICDNILGRKQDIGQLSLF